MKSGSEQYSQIASTTTHLTSSTTSRISTSIKYKNNQHQRSSVCSMLSTTELETFLKQGLPESGLRTSRKMRRRACKSIEESNQIRSFNKLFEQQERHTQIMERILDIEGRLFTELASAPRASRSPAKVDRNSNVQYYHFQDWGQFARNVDARNEALSQEDKRMEKAKCGWSSPPK